jgi:hypothetical protein
MAVSGTMNRLAMFTSATSVGDSIITQSGTTGIDVVGSVSADSVSSSGAVSAASLSVTSGLPITLHWDTGTPSSNTAKVYFAYAGDDPAGRPSTKDMTDYGRSVCFLTNIRIHDSADNGDAGECDIVVTAGNKWQLVASRSTGVDVDCAARCISW